MATIADRRLTSFGSVFGTLFAVPVAALPCEFFPPSFAAPSTSVAFTPPTDACQQSFSELSTALFILEAFTAGSTAGSTAAAAGSTAAAAAGGTAGLTFLVSAALSITRNKLTTTRATGFVSLAEPATQKSAVASEHKPPLEPTESEVGSETTKVGASTLASPIVPTLFEKFASTGTTSACASTALDSVSSAPSSS